MFKPSLIKNRPWRQVTQILLSISVAKNSEVLFTVLFWQRNWCCACTTTAACDEALLRTRFKCCWATKKSTGFSPTFKRGTLRYWLSSETLTAKQVSPKIDWCSTEKTDARWFSYWRPLIAADANLAFLVLAAAAAAAVHFQMGYTAVKSSTSGWPDSLS